MRSRPTDLVRYPAQGRRWIWVGIGGLAAALFLAWLMLPLGTWVADFERWMLGLGIWGVAIFAAVFIAATLVLAPDWPLAIAAGMVYGIWAFPVIVAAATIAASLFPGHCGRGDDRGITRLSHRAASPEGKDPGLAHPHPSLPRKRV